MGFEFGCKLNVVLIETCKAVPEFTPTNHYLAQVQISLDHNVKWEQSFSVLIHKCILLKKFYLR